MPLQPTIRPSRPIPFLRRVSRSLVIAGCIGVASAANAQLFENKDWKESQIPPPPAFNESRLVPIEMPRYMSLQFGVDPATIAITGDGVVRYVVVAANRAGGANTAYYEGIRCATGEVKSYARWNDGTWETIGNADWKPMRGLSSTYSMALATQAICRSAAPRSSVGEMISNLKNPVREVE